MADLFDLETRQMLREGAVLLRSRALPVEKTLLSAIDRRVLDRKSTRLNSSHRSLSRMPSSA